MKYLLPILLTASLAFAQTRPTPATATAPVGPPVARALIIGGPGGSEAYSRNVADWVGRFAAVLTQKCGLKPENVIVMTEKDDPKALPPRQASTLENVSAALARMKTQLGPNDQFILFFAGHGQINEPVGKFCLPSQDLKADELAAMLDELPTRKIVLINCASGGAEFVKTCANPGRIIISGGGGQDNGTATYFAEFFVGGYETGLADLNKDGRIDLLEAFHHAGHETANFYHRQYLIPSASRDSAAPLTWYVRGRQTRAIWKRLYAGTTSVLSGPPKPKDKDAPPLPDPETEEDFEPKFGDFGPEWHNRRVLSEHARLDDAGGKKGFSTWQPYTIEKFPPDEPGADGYFARRTILGQPALLKDAPAMPVKPVAASSPATKPAATSTVSTAPTATARAR